MGNTFLSLVPDEVILNKILLLRGVRVIVDRDIASLYGVETKVLNQAVKRNIRRFPDDFMFQMSEEEFRNWKSQFVTSKNERMGLRKIPFVFTEQGILLIFDYLKQLEQLKSDNSEPEPRRRIGFQSDTITD